MTPGVQWTDRLAVVQMPSKAEWAITFGDVVIAIALFLLFIEGLKANRAAGKPMVDHFLSMLVLFAAIAEFLLVKEAANSIFALITAICLVDLLSIVTMRSAFWRERWMT